MIVKQLKEMLQGFPDETNLVKEIEEFDGEDTTISYHVSDDITFKMTEKGLHIDSGYEYIDND